MGKERDRITFDLKDLRERLQSVSTEPGQSLSSVLRWVAILGLDLLDACSRLRIPPPRLGEIDKWLIQISNVNPQPEQKKLSELISGLSFTEIEESAIPFDRILAIKRGDNPTPHEVTKLARILGRSPAEIRDLVKENYANEC